MSPRRPAMPRIALMLAAALALGAVAVSPPALAREQCYGEWSDAAPIVERERLKSARDVQDMARHELGGDVVRIVLCEADGSFVYRLVVRRLDGRIGNLVVSASR